ncbi:MAG: hypothetical protein IKN48_00120 [Bacteroidaceae bacterium]|nr:hypothetical protein [Bacteroidaceae bacterium]
MKFNTIVEKDKSGLEMILDAMNELLEGRFIEGIRYKHHSLYEIAQTKEEIGIYQHRLNLESIALVRFSESFISQYATDNNECFNEAEVFVNKITSTLCCIRELFKKMTPIVRDKVPVNAEAPSVFDVSPLGKGIYSEDLFGLESFSKEVQELYKALETLLSTATSILALCHLMIESVEKTRNDTVRLKQIYKDSCQELLETVKAASAFVAVTQELPENELEERRKKAGSEDNEKFLQDNYHRYSKKDFTQFLIIKVVREARSNGLTEKEAFFWHDNRDKALLVRKAIENFDSINGAEGKNGRLSSDVVVKFLIWSEVPQPLQRQLYNDYFIPNYITHGKLKQLGWSAISDRRKFRKELGITDEQTSQDFEQMLLSAIADNSETPCKIA